MELGVRANGKVKEAIDKAIQFVGLKELARRCGMDVFELSEILRGDIIPLRVIKAACEVNKEYLVRPEPPFLGDPLRCIEGCIIQEVPREVRNLYDRCNGGFNWREVARILNIAIDMLVVTLLFWYIGKSFLPKLIKVESEVGETIGAIIGALLSTLWAIIKILRWPRAVSRPTDNR